MDNERDMKKPGHWQEKTADTIIDYTFCDTDKCNSKDV